MSVIVCHSVCKSISELRRWRGSLICFLCGDGKSGESTWLKESGTCWRKRVVLLFVEENRKFVSFSCRWDRLPHAQTANLITHSNVFTEHKTDWQQKGKKQKKQKGKTPDQSGIPPYNNLTLIKVSLSGVILQGQMVLAAFICLFVPLIIRLLLVGLSLFRGWCWGQTNLLTLPLFITPLSL